MSDGLLLGESPIARIKPLFNIWFSRPPLPPHVYMKSYTDHAATPPSTVKSAFGRDHNVIGLPKLPLTLLRRIFETCALEKPEVCTVLLLVARRVHVWSVGALVIKWLPC